MVISDYFREQYLTAGNTYDNFIFEGCPDEFLDEAQRSLSQSNDDTKPCVVSIGREQEKLIERTLSHFTEDFQKQVLARDFITSSVMRELLQYTDRESELKDFAISQLDAFRLGDYDRVRQMHGESLMPFDIRRVARRIGKIELDFILDGTQNKFLQQAINIFISAREPYSVKVFTNNKGLPTYYDTNGNIIQCPHDFMRRDVREFIESPADSMDCK